MKPTQGLLKYCKQHGINPEALDHMLFQGKNGPTVMWAHMQELLGKAKFKYPCKTCQQFRTANREHRFNVSS